MDATLHYIADPMCAWCWGFKPVLTAALNVLDTSVHVAFVMGGLAPDSDEPMPAEMRRYVQSAWDEVERATGARFNRAFWERCEPRRSTWLACRAVLAAEAQNHAAGRAMFAAIQNAYYLEARNPSLPETLIALAHELEVLDVPRFERELDAPANRERLAADRATARRLGVQGFPSLVLEREEQLVPLARGYRDADVLLARLAREGLAR